MPAILIEATPLIVPPQADAPDKAVAYNFERFDGLDPLDNAPNTRPDSGVGSGADYGFDQPGHYPRPGQSDQPIGQVYTSGPVAGLTNTLGGQPLPIHDWRYPLHGTTMAHDYILAMQNRRGVGQNFQGLAQTVALADITNNPPQPESLESILAAGG